MSASTPKVGEVLRCEYGEAIVVQPETSVTEGLLTLLLESYGGPRFSPDNPAIVAALPRTTRQTWRSTTKAYRESECIDDGFLDDYWCPDGDGARQITVVHFDGNVCDLGDAAAEAESSVGAQRLLRAIGVTQQRHSSDGWFCDLDNCYCGSSLDEFCPCCKRAYGELAGEGPEAA